MTCCLPGAGVRDVVERYGRIVKGTGKEAVVTGDGNAEEFLNVI